MNLFDIAQHNATALEEKLDDLYTNMSADGSARLDSFSARVAESGRISLNLRQDDMLGFITTGSHLNAHELAEQEASRQGISVDASLRNHLGSFYERRMAFDLHFDNGKQFRYGALNLGGCGVSHFGEYCVVAREEVSSQRPEVAYLQSDSALTYVGSDNSVNDAVLREESAPHSHRQVLASLKHKGEMVLLAEENWPAVVCSGSDYIEAVFCGKLGFQEVESVRVSQSEYVHNVMEAYRTSPSDAALSRADKFQRIREGIEGKGLTLEVIDDD